MANSKDILIGSVFIASSQICYGVIEVLVKLSEIKLVQFIIVRSFVELLGSIIVWKIKYPTINRKFTIKNIYGDSEQIKFIWSRGMLKGLSTLMHYYAITKLPIGDFEAIFHQAPLLTVLFGWLVLREKLPDLYVLIPSVIMMICGILLVSQPPFLYQLFDHNNANNYQTLNVSGLIAVFIAAFGWVSGILLVRRANGAHFLQLQFAASICGLFIVHPMTLIINHYYTHIEEIGNLDFHDEQQWSFTWKSLGFVAGYAFLGCLASVFNIIGYQYGTATTVSWLEYINIPIGFIYQIFIFNDIPNKYEIIGGVSVTIACLIMPIQQLYQYLYNIDDTESEQSERIALVPENTKDTNDIICAEIGSLA